MITQQTVATDALLVKDVEPFTGLCFTTRTTLRHLSRYGAVAQDLYHEAGRLSLDVAGPVQWIYTGVNGDPTNEFQLDIVLPVRQEGTQPNEFRYRQFEWFRCTSYTFLGPWSELMAFYDTLFPMFYRDGHQNDGRVREIYTVMDFETPENNVTEIQIGIV